jgi:hypothetical protein
MARRSKMCTAVFRSAPPAVALGTERSEPGEFPGMFS